MTGISDLVSKLGEINQDHLYGKDFLLTWEKTENDLKRIMLVAELLRTMRENNISPKVFDSGLAVSIFRDNSTRTRFSYASAANLLGLAVQDMDETKSQVAHGETVRETAAMISFLTDFIGIRDDMYPGLGNSYMTEVGEALDEGHREGILPVRPGIVNLQCDLDHPTQSLSDLLHLQHHFGNLEALKGKKMVMSWAYSPSYGKPMSVPQGIIALMTRFGLDITLAHPPGYELMPDIVAIAEKNARDHGGRFRMSNDMGKSMVGADIVYPKSWAPYHIMEERTQLLETGDREGLVELEKKGLDFNKRFMDWEYNENSMKKTRDGKALYMHCLPADISGVSCEHGEVSAGVFEQFRLKTYHEASWKPWVIAAMMLSQKFEHPELVLKKIAEKGINRCKNA